MIEYVLILIPIICFLIFLRKRQLGVVGGSSPYNTKYGAKFATLLLRYQGYETKISAVNGCYIVEYWLKENKGLFGIGE